MTQTFNPAYTSSYYTLEEIAKNNPVDNEFRKAVSTYHLTFNSLMGVTGTALLGYEIFDTLNTGVGFWSTAFGLMGGFLALGSYTALNNEIKLRKQFNQEQAQDKELPRKYYLLDDRISLEETVIEKAHGVTITPCTLKTISKVSEGYLFIDHLLVKDVTQRIEIETEEVSSDEYGGTSTRTDYFKCGEFVLSRKGKTETFHYRCKDDLSPGLSGLFSNQEEEIALLFKGREFSTRYFCIDEIKKIYPQP
ncbi:MAG: hypothetical protein WCV90_02990 [Candidatus Woesearchaeota archaeon]